MATMQQKMKNERQADRRFYQARLRKVIAKKDGMQDVWIEMLKEHEAKYGILK